MPRTGAKRVFERFAVMAADMQHRAEERDMLDAGLVLQARQQMAHIAPFDQEGDQARLLDDLGDRALRDDLAEIDVDDAVAALGFVHVVRAHEHG